jgi:transposase
MTNTPPPPKALPVINPHAAGIDVGSQKMFVSVAGGPPHVFGCCTADLRQLCDWLRQQGARTVALEATGVYWLCLYAELEAAGLEVYVVNGAHVKQVPGRKTDMADCQWLATLHAHGLLRRSFVPAAPTRQVRDVVRLRDDLITMAAAHLQHMHKALERLGLKIHTVLSDLSGFSGLQLVRAIVGGERRAEVLVELCDAQVRLAKRAALLKALEGNWQAEHLLALKLALEGWDFYQRQIGACDEHLQGLLGGQVSGCPAPDLGPKKELRHNAPKAMPELQTWMGQLFGTDLTRLPALNEYTLMKLYGEIGADLGRWPTEKHFTAWLGLAPAHQQSGRRRRRQWRPMGRGGAHLLPGGPEPGQRQEDLAGRGLSAAALAAGCQGGAQSGGTSVGGVVLPGGNQGLAVRRARLGAIRAEVPLPATTPLGAAGARVGDGRRAPSPHLLTP